jgi:hypothetical protein
MRDYLTVALIFFVKVSIFTGCVTTHELPAFVDAGTCETACTEPPDLCHTGPGACRNGTCQYAAAAEGTPCDDADGCTVADACRDGVCVGVTRVCDDAPPPRCADEHTLEWYPGVGMCGGGVCRYAPVYAPCPGLCVNDACSSM